MNLIQQLEAEAIEHFSQTKTIPEFRPGDTLRVGVKVVEGERTRIQNFEGVCIARANRGLGSSFTVRKISFGEGVERLFPLYSPNIESIEVVHLGAALADDHARAPRVHGHRHLARLALDVRSEEHTSELQSLAYLVCRL